MADEVHIIGAGLAGSEAAWQLAERGVKTVIHEMRPSKASPAHKTEYCAELVCSNSLRSDDYEHNAVGLMHEEMRRAGSLIMQCADATKVPAGGALAVDRDGFAETVTRKLKNHPLISFINEEITALPAAEDGSFIIASGPLTSEALIASILKEVNAQTLNFYDAIAPVVYKESIDFDKAWYQSRYDKGDKFDYINCPLTQEEYYAFVNALLSAEKVEFHDFEKEASYFDGCLPIEIMAERGIETLVFGPMKPVGLTNPHNPEQKPYAVVQLRQDNKEDTLRNMVGFQTKLKYGEQQRIFRMIPGLENAEFVRYGVMHQNTFLQSPKLLDKYYADRRNPLVAFAGQMTGVEGYVESTASGYLAAVAMAAKVQGREVPDFPKETAIGALGQYVSDESIENFQPMNINFSIIAPLEKRIRKKAEKKLAIAARSLDVIDRLVAKGI